MERDWLDLALHRRYSTYTSVREHGEQVLRNAGIFTRSRMGKVTLSAEQCPLAAGYYEEARRCLRVIEFV
jgi:hypothetical protein